MTAPIQIDDILRWVEDVPLVLGEKDFPAVDTMIEQLDPGEDRKNLAELFWTSLTGYVETESIAFIQLSRHMLGRHLQAPHLNYGRRCAYTEFSRLLTLPQERLTSASISELFDLYAEAMDLGHAINGDPIGGYGALHILALLHDPHPQHALDVLGRAIKAGFDINQVDRVGESPLLALVSRNDYPGMHEMVQAMLEAGANPMLTSAGGRCCWFCATSVDEPFELLDLMARYTPHAREHGRPSDEELRIILASASTSARIQPDDSEQRTLETWVHDRLLRGNTPVAEAVSRAGPRL